LGKFKAAYLNDEVLKRFKQLKYRAFRERLGEALTRPCCLRCR